jgi:hypothetical protein
MTYRVKVGPHMPNVVDMSGQPVSGARVMRIEFPDEEVTGPDGTYKYISGPGVATIRVNGQEHSHVPLCS